MRSPRPDAPPAAFVAFIRRLAAAAPEMNRAEREAEERLEAPTAARRTPRSGGQGGAETPRTA